MSFLDIALRNAARGFRVFPLAEKDKSPWCPGGVYDATSDPAKITEWAKTKANANVGCAGGKEFIGVDTDRKDRLFAICRERGVSLDIFKTYTVESGKPNRAHFYYLPTPEAGAFGIKKASEKPIPGNIFETKPEGAYLVGEGSIHPENDAWVYRATQDIPHIPFPAELLRLLKELDAELNKRGKDGKKEWPQIINDGEGREEFLVEYAGTLRRKGENEDTIYELLAVINANRIAPPKPEADLKRIAHSIGRKPLPAPEPVILIGGRRPGLVDESELDVAEKTVRPIFPDESWDGTIFGAFADIVCRGTNIRKRLASEPFRAITGAIAGDQVTCGLAGVRLRDYLAMIAFRQAGKSYGLDRSVDFYTRPTIHNIFEPLLMLAGGKNNYRPTGIGAQRFLPGSSNSFVDELNRKDKRKKDEPVDVDLQNRWKPTARYITIQGEAMALFARLCNPDWSGQTLSALVTDLYDSLDAEVPITGERGAPKLPVRLQYSMVVCTQPQIWKKYMAAHMMDSGLFGRFYIVGTEYKPKRVTLPDYETDSSLFQEHFGALRRDVFSRLDYLKDHPLLMTIAPEAKRRIQEWENNLLDEDDLGRDLSSRMGLHVWRAAMARAWGAIPQRVEITLEDADAAIRLGEYQVKMRQYYSAIPGDSPRALHLNSVTMSIEQAGQLSLRDLKGKVRGDRWPEDFDWAIDRLQKRGQVVVRDMPRKQKLVCWVKEA
jgi:hypothetical protein